MGYMTLLINFLGFLYMMAGALIMAVCLLWLPWSGSLAMAAVALAALGAGR